jgi:hypothetical protein
MLSENGTFWLGFFSTNHQLNWYLGIWFASVPTKIFFWVANRENQTRNLGA